MTKRQNVTNENQNKKKTGKDNTISIEGVSGFDSHYLVCCMQYSIPLLLDKNGLTW